MTEVLLFHHALGLTDGIRAFAEDLRGAGHVVHTPDLFEGKTFDSVPDGVANARQIGFGTILERGAAAAEGLPNGLVYGGFSLGVMPAQSLTQTRPGARGGLFAYGFPVRPSSRPPGRTGCLPRSTSWRTTPRPRREISMRPGRSTP
jgi:dienelactone hydrolase